MNINDRVWIRLTPDGEKFLEEKKYKWLRRDENGWSRWLLWEFMHVFGEHVYMGSIKQYFDYGEIRFDDPNK